MNDFRERVERLNQFLNRQMVWIAYNGAKVFVFFIILSLAILGIRFIYLLVKTVAEKN